MPFEARSAICFRNSINPADAQYDRFGMNTERFEQWRVAAVCSCLRPDPVVGMLTINSPPRLGGKIRDRLGARHIVEPLGTVQRCGKTVERYLEQAGIDRSTTNLEGLLKDIGGLVAAVLRHQFLTLAPSVDEQPRATSR